MDKILLEVYSCPVRGVLNIGDIIDIKTAENECADTVEITQEEAQRWMPIIKEYHKILDTLNKRGSTYHMRVDK